MDVGNQGADPGPVCPSERTGAHGRTGAISVADSRASSENKRDPRLVIRILATFAIPCHEPHRLLTTARYARSLTGSASRLHSGCGRRPFTFPVIYDYREINNVFDLRRSHATVEGQSGVLEIPPSRLWFPVVRWCRQSRRSEVFKRTGWTSTFRELQNRNNGANLVDIDNMDIRIDNYGCKVPVGLSIISVG